MMEIKLTTQDFELELRNVSGDALGSAFANLLHILGPRRGTSKKYHSNFVEATEGTKEINGTTLYQCKYVCSCGVIGKRFVKEDAIVTSCHKCETELIVHPATDNDAHDDNFNYFVAY